MGTRLDEEREEADVTRLVHEVRSRAGLSRKELAARVGTTPSVISRLESANYGRHSLSMLRRIAAAVGQRVEIRFVPVDLAGPHRIASRPGGERRPDPPIPAREIGAPVDLPRPGKAVRCRIREGLHRLPDPYIPEYYGGKRIGQALKGRTRRPRDAAPGRAFPASGGRQPAACSRPSGPRTAG